MMGSDQICFALVVCQQKLVLIQASLGKVENTKRLVSRSWARLRLVIKKDEITEFERELGQALNILNVSLTANIMCDGSVRVPYLYMLMCSFQEH